MATVNWEDDGFLSNEQKAGADAHTGRLQSDRFWENPKHLGDNKEPAHAQFVPQSPDSNAAWILDLNGCWSFVILDRPEETPASFQMPEFDDSSWAKITVPGHWELQGFGQQTPPTLHEGPESYPVRRPPSARWRGPGREA